MNLKYRHALVRNRQQTTLKADYLKFAQQRRTDRIKDLKRLFLGMLPALLLIVAFAAFCFFWNWQS